MNMTREEILALPLATLDDVRARETAIIAECCDGYKACHCTMPPLRSDIAMPRRLPVEEPDPATGGVREKICATCEDPVYPVELQGRRAEFCRSAINHMKMESGSPPERSDSIAYDIEVKYDRDGFVAGFHRWTRRIVVLENLISLGLIRKLPDGHLIDVPEEPASIT